MTFALWISLLLCTGCIVLPAPGQSSRPADDYGDPKTVCQITDRCLNEASGLVASRRNPGIYYTHNDSGGKPYVYALDRTGRIVTEIRLHDAENVDWEDIAIAPGETADTFDICAADIGDNNAKRKSVRIYRFPEPEIKLDEKSDTDSPAVIKVTPRVFRLKYVDGPRNAEGFVVEPTTGDGYVLDKREDGRCDVYRLAAPWNEKDTTTIQRAGGLTFPPALPLATMVTGADLSPDGRRLVTRSYPSGWEWRLPSDVSKPDFLQLIVQTPTSLNLAPERQGEGICYSADGQSILTISEGTPTALHEIRREKP